MKIKIRKTPAFLNNAVVYQLFLRPFTQEGTFAAAGKLLPHLKDIGVDIIMLCPVNEADGDEDQKFWSPRQIKSGLNNPKNPYRIRNYENIDEEYGSKEDFRKFVSDAHELGFRVLMDFVFFHCGPTCTFFKDHPDFVIRGPAGEVINGPWCFPALDFTNHEMRRYLIGNMRFFTEKFGIDGCRMDVGTSKIPLDFFVEARRELDTLRPDYLMITEGNTRDDQVEAFDAGYSYYGLHLLEVFAGKRTISHFSRSTFIKDNFPDKIRMLNWADNHDIASDAGARRFETVYGSDAKRAILAAVFSFPGIPMLYNGEEIADTNPHSIYANRFYPGHYCIDWQNALTKTGKDRLAFIRKLTWLRHNLPAFYTDADAKILGHDSLVLIRRETYYTIMNPGTKKETFDLPEKPVTVILKQKIRLQEKKLTIDPYGFVILQLKTKRENFFDTGNGIMNCSSKTTIK